MQDLLEMIQTNNSDLAWSKENYCFENSDQANNSEKAIKIKFVPLLKSEEQINGT